MSFGFGSIWSLVLCERVCTYAPCFVWVWTVPWLKPPTLGQGKGILTYISSLQESGNWWDEMVLFVEEPLRWQVPPLALCQLHPADLQGRDSFEGMNKTCTIFSFMWWRSQFDPSEVACGCLKCPVYRSREVTGRVVCVCILIFGPNLGSMLTGTSPMRAGESVNTGSLIWSFGDCVLPAVGIHSLSVLLASIIDKSVLPLPPPSLQIGWDKQVHWICPHFCVSRRCLEWTVQASSRCIPSLCLGGAGLPNRVKCDAFGSVCCCDCCIYFKKGDSKVVELKAARYNLSWLEFRMVQIKYAEIIMMIQDKNIPPLPPMSGRESPLDFSSIDFKQSIQNLVFPGSSLPALLRIPYSGRVCLVQPLSLWLLWKGTWE